tara:strand:- start:8491 stop:9318 length:828 start_codon:yes stop_codon:yes gene_type:complete
VKQTLLVKGADGSWSNQVVSIWVLVMFVSQLGVLYWLGRTPLEPVAMSRNAPMHLLPEILFTPDTGPGPEFSDPTLFTRPNRRGFSGTAWSQFPVVKHKLIDWDESPRLFANLPAKLGATFRETLPRHLAAVSAVPPKGLAKQTNLTLPQLSLRAESELEFLGNFSDRPLVRSVSVPDLPHDEALRRTLVRIGVNSDGYVVSATVPDRLAKVDTQQAAADRRALELLRGIRFEPVKRKSFDHPDLPGALEWGNALFHWRTAASPKPTNANAPKSN